MRPPSTGDRILMTTDAVGGVWTYALDLARGLAAEGVHTSLVVLGPDPSPAQRREAEAIDGLDLIETRLPLDWLAGRPAEIVAAGAALSDLASSLDVELVHLNSPALAAAGAFHAPVVGAIHSCLATWWKAVREGPMPADFRWRSQLLRKGLSACDVLVAPSGAFARAVEQTYRVRRPRTVRNGRSLAPRGSERREACVATAGRLWDDGKNVALLDAAAAGLRAPLYAIGPTRGPSGEHRLLKHAQALGPLPSDEVRLRLAESAIFASAALYEPFGLTVLEAAQAGCALALSDIPTFRELWEGAAVFLPPDNADAWTLGLQALLADPDRTRGLGAKARARAGRYTRESMTHGILAVYGAVAPALDRLSAGEAVA